MKAIALDKIADTDSISVANENQLLKFMRPIWEHYDEFKKVSRKRNEFTVNICM